MYLVCSDLERNQNQDWLQLRLKLKAFSLGSACRHLPQIPAALSAAAGPHSYPLQPMDASGTRGPTDHRAYG